MARGASGTTTDDDEGWEWDWTMVELLIMFAVVLLSSVPYFYGYITNPPNRGKKGSGRDKLE